MVISAGSKIPVVSLGCGVVPGQHFLVPAALQVLLQQLLGRRGDAADVAAQRCCTLGLGLARWGAGRGASGCLLGGLAGPAVSGAAARAVLAGLGRR